VSHVVAVAQDDGDLAAFCRVRTIIDPRIAPDVPTLRHMRGYWHDLVMLVARVDGVAAGCALGGVFPGMKDEPDALGDVGVAPAYRGRGIGTELLQRITAHARTLGKSGLLLDAGEADSALIAWLERRGFVEVERQKAVELDLTTIVPAEGEPPAGIEIATRAERPDVLAGMYEVVAESNEDLSGLDAGLAWTFDEWKTYEVDRPSRRPELCFVALDGDLVVGHASVDVIAGNASHGLTGVRRSYRRRGIGRALKLALIGATKEAGFPSLLTESEEANAQMRRLNESLGYRPVPGMVVMRGSTD
jgi:GNAT superfamily N-acetyltransferase